VGFGLSLVSVSKLKILFVSLLIDCLRHLRDAELSVMVDSYFTLPNIDWSDSVLVSSREYCSTLFYTFVSQQGLNQYVTENSRPSTNHAETGSLLNIVLYNDAFAISNVHVSQLFSMHQ